MKIINQLKLIKSIYKLVIQNNLTEKNLENISNIFEQEKINLLGYSNKEDVKEILKTNLFNSKINNTFKKENEIKQIANRLLKLFLSHEHSANMYENELFYSNLSLLQYAVLMNCEPIIELLVKNNSDLSYVSTNGATALSLYNSISDIYKVEKNKSNYFKNLLTPKVNINEVNNEKKEDIVLEIELFKNLEKSIEKLNELDIENINDVTSEKINMLNSLYKEIKVDILKIKNEAEITETMKKVIINLNEIVNEFILSENKIEKKYNILNQYLTKMR